MIKTLGSQERQGQKHHVCSQRLSLTTLRGRLEVAARDALFGETQAGSMGLPLESGIEVTCVILGLGHRGHASSALFAGTLAPSHPAKYLTAQRLPCRQEAQVTPRWHV